MFKWLRNKLNIKECKCNCPPKLDVWSDINEPMLGLLEDLTQMFDSGFLSDNSKKNIKDILKERSCRESASLYSRKYPLQKFAERRRQREYVASSSLS